MVLPSMERIILVVACIVSSAVPAWTFVSTFGVAQNAGGVCFLPQQYPQHQKKGRAAASFPPLFAGRGPGRPKKSENADDDWQPDASALDDADIAGGEGLGLVDDGALGSTPDDDEDGAAAAAIDDDDDDDDIDEDLDIWEEDEDDDSSESAVEYEDDLEIEEEGITPYLNSEGGAEEEDWEEEEEVPLQDDPDDPNYNAQRKLMEETVGRRTAQAELDAFDEVDFIMNKMTPEQAREFEETDIQKKVNAAAAELIDMDDSEVVEQIGDLDKTMAETTSILDDPYENEGEQNIMGTGLSDDLLERFDNAVKTARQRISEEPWDKVNHKAQTLDWAELSNQTIDEMDAALDEIGGSSYNCTNWLLYDLDFNVTNLVLAAIKHNSEAPIIFQHWYPQLFTYERYKCVRDINFDFTWDDVENADMEELERYYFGFGYTEIPKKAPGETGIIDLEDMDEEELKMAAFDSWVKEVYNPEMDRKDFDDDKFQDEDNVFSKFYEPPQHPDLPKFEDALDDLAEWEAEVDDDDDISEEYAHVMGHSTKYKYVHDEEFEREFRGHLVIACGPMDEDLAIAEKITVRMREEFGKKIYAETRVFGHAREEDLVFEVWLESYEIDLLHSRKRATGNVETWDGPAEVDDEQLDYLVERVRFLISDLSRYSYRYSTENREE